MYLFYDTPFTISSVFHLSTSISNTQCDIQKETKRDIKEILINIYRNYLPQIIFLEVLSMRTYSAHEELRPAFKKAESSVAVQYAGKA